MAEKVDKEDNAEAGVAPTVTDAVTQANLKTLSEAPAMAMGTVYQSLSHANALLFENMVNAQQQNAIAGQAAMTQCVMALLGEGGAAKNPTRGKK